MSMKVETCLLNAPQDLETFPHMSHAWETPVIWFASMCRCIFLYGPCFPQTLHEAIFPSPVGIVIIDFICSFRPSRTLSFVTATVVSYVGYPCRLIFKG